MSNTEEVTTVAVPKSQDEILKALASTRAAIEKATESNAGSIVLRGFVILQTILVAVLMVISVGQGNALDHQGDTIDSLSETINRRPIILDHLNCREKLQDEFQDSFVGLVKTLVPEDLHTPTLEEIKDATSKLDTAQLKINASRDPKSEFYCDEIPSSENQDQK